MERTIVVHLVHGTWGRGFLPVILEELPANSRWSWLFRTRDSASEAPLWFAPESEFRRSVAGMVEPALRDQLEFREFLWTGSNSMRARKVAADALRSHLQSQLLAAPDACHLLVAHSHGGVVAFDAVTRNGGTGKLSLDGILSLGTPYLAVGEDTEDNLNLLSFGILPTAVVLYFVALLAALAVAGFYAAAVWLAAMFVGLFATLVLLPRVAERPVLRSATRAVVFLSGAAALYGAFFAVVSWFPLPQPAVSFAGYMERAVCYPCGGIAALLSATLLLGSQATAVRGPRGESFMLRDSIVSLLSFVVPAIICFSAASAFTSQNGWFNNLAAFFVLWPVASLFARHALFKDSSSISRRSTNLWKVLNEEQEPHKLPCSLYALRLPGDEASLAIAASLIARGVVDLITLAIELFFELKKTPRWLAVLFIAVALTGMAGGVRQMLEAGTAGWLAYVGGAILGVLLLCFVVAIGALLLTSCVFVFSLLTIGVMALAVGPEVTQILPAARVDCEPLPRCVATEDCRFELAWVSGKRSGLSLRHSLHELEPVRQRVAEWIGAHAKRGNSHK
jgi:hypothetical protein